MTSGDFLLQTPFFNRVRARDVRATESLWSAKRLRKGQTLWMERDPVTAMGLLVDGELSVVSGGVEVGRISRGRLVGEVLPFMEGSHRTASVSALLDAHLLTLSTRNLTFLQERSPAIYNALLERALVTMSTGLQSNHRRAGQVPDGSYPTPRRSGGGIMRFFNRFSSKGPSGEPMPLKPLLSRAAKPFGITLADRFADNFEPVAVEAGRPLYLEGEEADAAYMVTKNELEVVRGSFSGGTHKLYTAGFGEMLGVGGMIKGGPRSTSAVAIESGWVWRVDRRAWKSLRLEARAPFNALLLQALRFDLQRTDTPPGKKSNPDRSPDIGMRQWVRKSA